MLKAIKTEETIGFFCHIFTIGGVSIWGGAGPPPWLRLCLTTTIVHKDLILEIEYKF